MRNLCLFRIGWNLEKKQCDIIRLAAEQKRMHIDLGGKLIKASTWTFDTCRFGEQAWGSGEPVDSHSRARAYAACVQKETYM